LLKDFYYMRWKKYVEYLTEKLEGHLPAAIDFYALEEEWTLKHNPYPDEEEGNVIAVARSVYGELVGEAE